MLQPPPTYDRDMSSLSMHRRITRSIAANQPSGDYQWQLLLSVSISTSPLQIRNGRVLSREDLAIGAFRIITVLYETWNIRSIEYGIWNKRGVWNLSIVRFSRIHIAVIPSPSLDSSPRIHWSSSTLRTP